MKLRRRITLGAASILILAAGAWCWREFTRVHTVIITVPDAPGFFAVWIRDDHPDVVEVRNRVASFAVPPDGLLRARSMSCIRDWHTERYLDERGQAVEDVRALGSATYSWRDGEFLWWYRGSNTNWSNTNPMYSSKAQEAWLRTKGIAK